jgi:hypothetical protein
MNEGAEPVRKRETHVLANGKCCMIVLFSIKLVGLLEKHIHPSLIDSECPGMPVLRCGVCLTPNTHTCILLGIYDMILMYSGGHQTCEASSVAIQCTTRALCT